MDSIGYRWCLSASKDITRIQDALALLAHEHRAGSDLSIISLIYINSLRKQIEDVFFANTWSIQELIEHMPSNCKSEGNFYMLLRQ